jgi:hypothetical protein
MQLDESWALDTALQNQEEGKLQSDGGRKKRDDDGDAATPSPKT